MAPDFNNQAAVGIPGNAGLDAAVRAESDNLSLAEITVGFDIYLVAMAVFNPDIGILGAFELGLHARSDCLAIKTDGRFHAEREFALDVARCADGDISAFTRPLRGRFLRCCQCRQGKEYCHDKRAEHHSSVEHG